MHFRGDLYPQFLQQSINDLRLCKVLCDVVLQVGDEEFGAHKLVLSAASPYFRTMFNAETCFKESTEGKIVMYDIDSDVLSAILTFIYTSEIDITEENVYLLMETANLLQIDALRGSINYYLRTTLTLGNCLSVYVASCQHCYYDLAKEAFHYLLINFSKVVNQDEFLQIPLDVLLEILSSKLLNITDEGYLLQSVLKWIKGDLPTRRQYLERLISKIELTQVPTQTLIMLKNDPLFSKTQLQSRIGSIINDMLAKKYESGVEDFISIWGGNGMKLEKFRYKSEQEVIFAVGGESSGMASRSIECFTAGYESWKYFVPQYVVPGKVTQETRVIPAMHCSRYDAALTSDSYNIYVLGGRNSNSLLDECETYDVVNNQWKALGNLPLKVHGGGAVLCEGRLIFVGGRSEAGALNQMWEYDDRRKVWKPLPPRNTPSYFHGTVAVKGYIFVIGGYDNPANETALQTCERFDFNYNRWFEMPPLREPRAKFGCAVIDDCIYVMGGIDGTVGLRSVEKFNTRTNKWSYESIMPVPRNSFSAAAFNRRIYCLGGSDTIHYLNTVDKFNPRTNKWHCVEGMQISRFGLGAATLMVPVIGDQVTLSQYSSKIDKKGSSDSNELQDVT